MDPREEDVGDTTPCPEVPKDDSGYQTNTPLSSEPDLQAKRSFEPAASVCQAFCSTGITDEGGQLFTPFAAINKNKPRLTAFHVRKESAPLKERYGFVDKNFLTVEHDSMHRLRFQPSLADDCKEGCTKKSEFASNWSRKRAASSPNLIFHNKSSLPNNERSRVKDPLKRLIDFDATVENIYGGWCSGAESSLILESNIDLIRKLTEEYNSIHIVHKIFAFLDPEDLVSVGKVSRLWCRILKEDHNLTSKRKACILSQEARKSIFADSKENVGVVATIKATDNFMRRRTSCVDIINSGPSSQPKVNVPGSSAAPVPTPKPQLFDLFFKAGQTHGGKLCMCPKCSHPAHINQAKGIAICLRAGCNFRFCSQCLFKAHGSLECRSLARGNSESKQVIISSNESKKNLGRL